jgi:quercetin dioxygenase-like cupin family protein
MEIYWTRDLTGLLGERTMRLLTTIAVVFFALGAAGHSGAQSGTFCTPTTPPSGAAATPSAAAEASCTLLADPVGTPAIADGTQMVLFQIVVPPGAEVEPHDHFGAFVWYIESGSIVYTSDGATSTGSAEGGEVPLRSGDEIVLEPGDWVVQYDNTEHSYRNDGDTTAVILAMAVYPPVDGCAGGCL